VDNAGTGGANGTPSISGFPKSAIKIGDSYSFTPSASDPDGDPLTFSISRKPQWATFDSATGRLSGQVLLGDVGVYDKVRIAVSDGSGSTSLPEHKIRMARR